MPKISAVIITFNEEKNIERCLKSLQGIVDEVVVLDSFSTDNTKNICLRYGVRFFEHEFDGHIEQKNRAITFASYPHILSLDADEALSDDLKNSVLKVKNNWKADGYTFNRLTNYCGKWIRHCGWYPDKKLRLFDSRKGRWAGINPHDTYVMDKNSRIEHISGDLLHYSFYSIEQHINQINKFSSIRAIQMYKNDKKAGNAKIVLSAIFKFIKSYFLQLGFLDGYYGLVISVNSAHASFLKYAKLKQLRKDDKQQVEN